MSKHSGKDDIKYLRMSKSERIQHFLLLSSFITLILTGFGLKFPEAFWVKWIIYIIGDNAFAARGIVHRIASVVMIGASIYHLYYIFFTSRGKQLIRDLFPKKQDLIDFKDSMFYLLGKSDDKPKLGRFSYIEKMEYWAVVWGTVIMGVTGSILWFENFFLKYVGTTGMDISTAIHYYEAILASLAILVWHYYFIFLNPDVYPMNKAWLKGYMTREQMEHEHPLELEQLEISSKSIDKNKDTETDDNADNNDNIPVEKKSLTEELPDKKNSNKSQSLDISDINDIGKDKKVNIEKNK